MPRLDEAVQFKKVKVVLEKAGYVLHLEAVIDGVRRARSVTVASQDAIPALMDSAANPAFWADAQVAPAPAPKFAASPSPSRPF